MLRIDTLRFWFLDANVPIEPESSENGFYLRRSILIYSVQFELGKLQKFVRDSAKRQRRIPKIILDVLNTRTHEHQDWEPLRCKPTFTHAHAWMSFGIEHGSMNCPHTQLSK